MLFIRKDICPNTDHFHIFHNSRTWQSYARKNSNTSNMLLVLCKLISLCKNKLYGGMFLIFSIIICNIPAFLIQISSKREAFNHMPDYLKQSLYFFGTVTLTFIGANVLSTSQQVQTRMEQASIQNLYCSTSFIPP